MSTMSPSFRSLPALRRAFLFSVLGFVAAPQAAAQSGGQPPVPHRVCFYVDGAGVPGHVFAQILPPLTGCDCQNPDAGSLDLAFGKYATVNNVLKSVPGEIKHDAHRRWSRRVCFDVTIPQYNAIVQKILFERAKPPDYHLTKRPPGNCVNWVHEIAALGGITLPNTRDNALNADAPAIFFASLGAVGNGGTFNPGNGGPTGLVEYNANPNIGPNGQPIAANPPRDVDATRAAAGSLDDPVTTSSDMVLPLAQTDLGTIVLATGGTLHVNLSNTLVDEALISIDWDDGSPRAHQSLAFSHAYSSPGTHQLALGVIDPGAVNAYTLRVDVSPGGPSNQTVNVTVPTPTPGTVPNPGFELTFDPAYSVPDGDSVPTMNEWALIALAAAVMVLGAVMIRRQAPLPR